MDICVCVCVRMVSFRLAYTATESTYGIIQHHQVFPTTQINSLLYFISILWDNLLIVVSTTKTCWWLAIRNKIHVTKEYSLVY
jgi:hypothetical protein